MEKKRVQRDAANDAGISTLVLIFQALHDLENMNFSTKRLNDIMTFSNKPGELIGKERNRANAGIDVSYTITFMVLHDQYHFGKKRLQMVQKKIKAYAWAVYDEVTTILEYMKCLSIECDLPWNALKRYEQANGPLMIYG